MIFLIDRSSYVEEGTPPIEEATLMEFDRWDVRTYKTPEEHDEAQMRVYDFGRGPDTPPMFRMSRSIRRKPTPWLQEGTDHETCKTGIRRKRGTIKEWAIDIPPEGIVKLLEKYGDLKIYASTCDKLPPRIKIWDEQDD